MKIRLFYHSLLSDWNHGNAHFLRGIVSELKARRHDVVVYEPKDAWSLRNLIEQHGRGPLRRFRAVYPQLKSVRYDPATLNVERAVAGADLVIAHEWNSPELIRRLGEARRKRDFVLLFHDTHHRLVTERVAMRACDFSHFDGVLAYGEVLRRLYLAERLVTRAWTWHEAADTRRFRPMKNGRPAGDLVWIGNWGDDERTEELNEFLIKPVKTLGLKARVYGVRYPEHARTALAEAGIEYGDWLANFEVPEVFAQFKLTVHIPRRPYVKILPGIPTIRPFEALACGIPLVCSPWRDAEHLFTAGKDYLVARDGAQMTRHLQTLLRDEARRRRLAERGLATIRERHTCAHRIDELMAIYREVIEERQSVVVTATKLFRRKPNAAHAAAAS
jgi:spore maturation protein CgeB